MGLNGEAVLKAVRVGYTYSGSRVAALERLDLEFRRGEVVVVTGPTGCGKSTLGMLVKGFMEPTSGWFELSTGARAGAETRMRLVGWAGAHPESMFFADTIEEEVGFGPARQGYGGEELRRRVEEALVWLGLDPAGCLGRHPRSLSGGERRRAALAAVAAMEYPLFVFDEPTAGLDDDGCRAVHRLARRLRDRGAGVVLLTHDPELLALGVDRELHLGSVTLADVKFTAKGESGLTDTN